MNRSYRIRKTISMRQLVSEFGEKFSKHTKKRLLDLGARCILTRKEESFRLDLMHIEHIKYDCTCNSNNGSGCKKEFAYGQFVIQEGELYFSEKCMDSNDTMQSDVVKKIYDYLDSKDTIIVEGIQAKKVDAEQIDFVIDSIMEVCPELSKEHMAILAKYV